MAVRNTTIAFEVLGGKYDADGDFNTKYCATFTNCSEALQAYTKYAEGYPHSYLRAVVEDGMTKTPKTLMGDCTDAEYAPVMLGFRVMSLWMTATGQHFTYAQEDASKLCDEIEDLLTRQRADLYSVRATLRNRTEALEALEKENRMLRLKMAECTTKLARINRVVKEIA